MVKSGCKKRILDFQHPSISREKKNLKKNLIAKVHFLPSPDVESNSGPLGLQSYDIPLSY